MSDSADVLDSHLAGLASALLPYREAAVKLGQWGGDLAWRLAHGGRILVAGNGGSAAEAQHLAAELVGKLRDDRAPLSAIAICAETSSLTAIGNDYGFEEIFARQVRAHGRPDDILLLLSTSGRSANLISAARAAAEVGVHCWAFTGPAPNPLAETCADVLAVPSSDPQVVQELHLVSAHILCEYVEAALPTVLGSARTSAAQPLGLAAGRRAGAGVGRPVGVTSGRRVVPPAGPPAGPPVGPAAGEPAVVPAAPGLPPTGVEITLEPPADSREASP